MFSRLWSCMKLISRISQFRIFTNVLIFKFFSNHYHYFLSSGKLRYLKYKWSLLKEGHWYKKTAISKPVTLLLSVDHLIDLQLTSNCIWFHDLIRYCMKTLTHIDSWCKIQDPNDELFWMVLLHYTQSYIEFSRKINQISGSIHTKLGTLLAWISFS